MNYGLFGLLLLPLGAMLEWRERLPEREWQMTRAADGVGHLALAVYLVESAQYLVGVPFRPLLTAFLRAPDDPWLGLRVLPVVLLVVVGLVKLLTGIARSSGPRDGLIAARASLKTAIGGAGLAWGWYVADAPQLNFCLKFVWIWCAVHGATKMLLALRGAGGGARKLVVRQVEETAVVWRPARPRAR
jgi:hypothetical protein